MQKFCKNAENLARISGIARSCYLKTAPDCAKELKVDRKALELCVGASRVPSACGLLRVFCARASLSATSV